MSLEFHSNGRPVILPGMEDTSTKATLSLFAHKTGHPQKLPASAFEAGTGNHLHKRDSIIRRQCLAIIIGDLGEAAFLDLLCPFRVLKHRAADPHEVEFALVEARFEVVE